MISVKNLNKSFGKRRVLKGIDFEADDGDFVIIVGNSGAGKTTLIHALIGAEKCQEGIIDVNGFRVNDLGGEETQNYRRNIGVVFQDYKLLPQKSVYENVAFALESLGFEDSYIKKRVLEVLETTGLSEQKNSFPSELSGGEKQRTAIARALVHAPKILFADEPTGNLDPENAMKIAMLLKAINENGTTVILATHNKEIVNLLKKRVIRLENGEIISDKMNANYN